MHSSISPTWMLVLRYSINICKILFQLSAIELKQPRPKQGKVKQVFSKLKGKKDKDKGYIPLCEFISSFDEVYFI